MYFVPADRRAVPDAPGRAGKASARRGTQEANDSMRETGATGCSLDPMMRWADHLRLEKARGVIGGSLYRVNALHPRIPRSTSHRAAAKGRTETKGQAERPSGCAFQIRKNVGRQSETMKDLEVRRRSEHKVVPISLGEYYARVQDRERGPKIRIGPQVPSEEDPTPLGWQQFEGYFSQNAALKIGTSRTK